MFFKKSISAYDMLIVGLGNIGKEYEHTRHNAGFDVLDIFCNKYSVTLNKNKFSSLFAEAKISDKRVLIAKPTTFMNKSGEAVCALCRFYKIPKENIIVISDDISLPPGKIRIREKGSAGGQKGLKSIIEHLSSDEFIRIKIGVGDRKDREKDLADWVLSKMGKEDKELFDNACENAVKALETILKDGVERAMNSYNK